jgi:hypothetical protein
MSKFSNFIKNLFSDFYQTVKEEIVMDEPLQEPLPKPKNISRKPKDEIKNTKTYKVKKHLIEKGTIDSWTAIELYGATRLSAIIFNLRMSGYNIDSIPNTAYDRNQQLCNFTTYKYINYNGKN